MSEDNSLESNLKKKLANGEINQEEYEELMTKFGDLDLLSSKVTSKKRTNYSISGSREIEGGEVSQPVKVSGRMRSTNSLTCPTLKVSGSAKIEGDLTVVEETKISGSLEVTENVKFGGPFKLSGKTFIGGSAYFTDIGKVSGKISVEDELILGDELKVSGHLQGQSIKSTSRIYLTGKITTDEDLEASEFSTTGGNSHIGGSLLADTVEIAKKYRLSRGTFRDDLNQNEFHSSQNEYDVDNLGNFISNMVTNFIPKIITSAVGGMMNNHPPGIFLVDGDIEGKIVDVSYTTIAGDLIGENIIVGPEVVVKGKIRYTKSIDIPESSDYDIEKINGKE